ncbi:MAG: molybdopterin-dependent oxidoreductase [Proteobacteria bacterium]|nr:molybdopterin-dependent oxidoreductase [Pseudomonadota bacterium]
MSSADSRVVQRTCPLCEAHCGIRVEVNDERRQVLGVRGDPDDVFSRGYICPKAYALKGLQEDPDRLTHPLRRTDSGFQEIGWDEAFELAGSRLAEIKSAHGADAIATYLGNPTAHDLGALLYVQPLLQVLGTRRRFSASSVDQIPKMLSSCLVFGGVLTIPIPDVDRTDYLLVLGANPLVSNGSLMTAPDMPGRLRRLRERGGKLVVIDPRRSETARVADEHHFIRPGSDAFFLFALVHVLFEEERVSLGPLAEHVAGVDAVRALARDFSPEVVAPVTGISAEVVRRIARELADAPSAACYGRIGTCTQEYGTLASWLVDVVNVLTGNLDQPGGALFPTPAASLGAIGSRTPGYVPYARWHSSVRGLPEFNGELPVATLAEEIDSAGEERIRALFLLAGNPVLSTPNGARLERALESLDFIVSTDIYLNETSRLADVILPPVSLLERSNYDILFHGLSVRNVSKFSPIALEAPENTRQQWEILLELTARVAGIPAAAVDEIVIKTILGSCVGGETSACPEVSEETARKALAEAGRDGGPERILDVLLRTGPYGDRFRGENGGLTLATLERTPEGIDHGPLLSQVPEILETASGKIELAPDLLVGDVERLRRGLAQRREAGGGGLVLIGRRQVRNNNSWMHNVYSLAKGRDRCTLLVHPDDAARHGLRQGERARLRSRAGEIEVPVAVSDEVMPGVVSLPHGFGHDAPGARLSVARERAGANSNLLCDEQLVDALSCNAVLNGIPVELLPAGPGPRP